VTPVFGSLMGTVHCDSSHTSAFISSRHVSALALVRVVPTADSCTAAKQAHGGNALFDYLIGAGDNVRRHGDVECPCRDKTDDEIEPGRLLDRDVGRFRPAQNLVDIVAGAPEQVRVVCSIKVEPKVEKSWNP
jgi:hypothetical protein